VAALLLVWVGTPTTPRRRKPRKPTPDDLGGLEEAVWTAGKTVAVAMLVVAGVSLAFWPLLANDPVPPQSPGSAERATGSSMSRGDRTDAARSSDLRWLLIPVAATVVALGPVAFAIRRRRMKEVSAAPDDGVFLLAQAVRASLAELESERDPRRAILRAYDSMERAFREVEIVRARDETASEFLGRTMRRLPVSSDAAAALTERFEEVRFSAHEITERDRRHALSSLRRVEQELAGTL
jgi:hypothetical protein